MVFGRGNKTSISMQSLAIIILYSYISHTVSLFTERTISFEKENYTVGEEDGEVEVCINSTDLMGVIEVEISPVMKGVDNPAAGSYIYKV